MSGRLVGEVLDHAPIDLRLLDRVVLIALAEAAQEKDRTARYNSSAVAIADRIQSTEGSVRNALLRLKNRGLIVPLLPVKGGRGHAQHWRLTKLTEHHRRTTWND